MEPCTFHFFRAVVLEEMVLMHIRQVLAFVNQYEDSFRETIGPSRSKELKQEMNVKQKRIAQAQRRVDELDGLFRHLYENNVSGKLTDERFVQPSGGYDIEQKTLLEMITMLEEEVDTRTADYTGGRIYPAVQEVF